MVKIKIAEDLNNLKVKMKDRGFYYTTRRGIELIVTIVDDKIIAINSKCPHAGGPLHLGAIKGNTLTCPWHQYDFNLRTKECKGFFLKSYEIEDPENGVFIIMP